MMETVLSWLQNNIDVFDVFFLVCIVVYRKGIFTAIAGGNGKLQMTELAQALLLVIFYISVRAERMRAHQYNVFSDAYMMTIITAVVVIAGIKEKVFHNFLQKNKEEKKE